MTVFIGNMRMYKLFCMDILNYSVHGHLCLIPVTQSFAEYGTPALAESALDIISATNQLILLKDHGFVALGESIASAGCLVLKTFREMLARIEKEELD